MQAVAQLTGDDVGIVGEALGRFPVRPATLVFQSLRQVPVIQRGKRTDVGLMQGVDETLVEVEALVVGLARSGGLDARPGDGKAAAFHVELAHDADVFPVTMVVVAGDVAGVAILDLTGSMGEAIPDGLAFAIFTPGAFDLIRSSGGAPPETFGENDRLLRLGQQREWKRAAGGGRRSQAECGAQEFPAGQSVTTNDHGAPRLKKIDFLL